MATCREFRMTSQHKLGCSRRRQSGSYVNYSDETCPAPLIEYGATDSGSESSGGGE